MSNESGSFKADKVSGIEGSIFATSALLEVVLQSNLRNVFKFPFYGLSFDDKIQKSDEWIDERLYTKVVEQILSYVMKNGAGYFKDVNIAMAAESDRLFDLSRNLTPNLQNLSDFELVQKYVEFMNIYNYSFGIGAVTFVYEGIMSERLTASISKRFDKPTEVIGSLISSPYKSFMMESEELLLKIKEEKEQGKKKALIEEYKEKFFYIRSNFSYSTILGDEEVGKLSEAVSAHKSQANARVEVSDTELLKEEKSIIAIFKETEVIRDKRKRANYIGNFTMFRFLEEACRRKGVDVLVGKRMFWNEFSDFVFDTENLSMRLKERTVASVVLDKGNAYYFDYNAIEPRQVLDASIEECSGTSACKGKGTAKANIILTTADFPKFKKGDILITEMTRPEFVPLMKEASAIITDEGGLTCHAAIVSRELNTPCIVGTKIATRIFKDGDMVEVDANIGIVKILKKS